MNALWLSLTSTYHVLAPTGLASASVSLDADGVLLYETEVAYWNPTRCALGDPVRTRDSTKLASSQMDELQRLLREVEFDTVNDLRSNVEDGGSTSLAVFDNGVYVRSFVVNDLPGVLLVKASPGDQRIARIAEILDSARSAIVRPSNSI